MARIELDKSLNILSMHGTLRRNNDGSKLVVRTDSRTGKMTMHMLNPQQRSTPVSDAEIAGRTRFGAIGRAVQLRRKAGDRRPYKTIWHDVAIEYDSQNQRT